MSDAYRVAYSPEAQEDVRAIYEYIAYELLADQAARGQVRRITETIRSLQTMPERFSVVDWEPWTSLGMRSVPVDNYIVFYLTDNDNKQVTIIRVFYSGRDIKSIVIDNSELI